MEAPPPRGGGPPPATPSTSTTLATPTTNQNHLRLPTPTMATNLDSSKPPLTTGSPTHSHNPALQHICSTTPSRCTTHNTIPTNQHQLPLPNTIKQTSPNTSQKIPPVSHRSPPSPLTKQKHPYQVTSTLNSPLSTHPKPLTSPPTKQPHLSFLTKTTAANTVHTPPSAPLNPPPLTRSFAEIVSSSAFPPASDLSFTSYHEKILPYSPSSTTQTHNCEPAVRPKYNGEPAAFFTQKDIKAFSQPLQFTLVGKFSYGRPSMELIRKDFNSIGFKSEVHIGLLDSRHVLIRFAAEADFQRCWIRSSWMISGFRMRTLKWTSDFRVDMEPAVAPVWLSLNLLPLHFFNHNALFVIAKSIGKPLKIDQSTITLSRPSVARICVYICLLEKPPNRIWIGVEDTGFWQPVSYENIPSYCPKCHKIGHNLDTCTATKITNPTGTSQPKKPTKQLPIWLPKALPQQQPSDQEQLQSETAAEVGKNSSEENSDAEEVATPSDLPLGTEGSSCRRLICSF